MKISVQAILLSLLAGIIFCLSSCTAGSCLDETEARVKASFYSSLTNKIQATDSVTLFGVNMDTLEIYNKTEKLTSIEFPLFASDTVCRFMLRINGINDTIKFSYTSHTHLLSKECGYTFFFDLDTAITTFNIIDSIKFTKKGITTFNGENLRIYY